MKDMIIVFLVGFGIGTALAAAFYERMVAELKVAKADAQKVSAQIEAEYHKLLGAVKSKANGVAKAVKP